jgi:hypothetical protein
MAFKAKFPGKAVDGRQIFPGDLIAKAGRGYRIVQEADPAPDEARGWWGAGEYPMADQVYDARGGATSDYEWYGDDDRGSGPDRYPMVLRDSRGRPYDVG